MNLLTISAASASVVVRLALLKDSLMLTFIDDSGVEKPIPLSPPSYLHISLKKRGIIPQDLNTYTIPPGIDHRVLYLA